MRHALLKVSKPIVEMDGLIVHQDELIGVTVGRLTIVAVIGGDGPGHAMCLCKCECGRHVIHLRSNLVRRVRTACGCQAGKGLRVKTPDDLTGQRFGKLVAISIEAIKGKRRSLVGWRCKCDCGNEAVIRAGHLKSGGSRSCGCGSKEALDRARRTTNRKRERNANWNPNLTDKDRMDRRLLFEATQWRKAVFERDSFSCLFCGQRGGRLHAHHLEPWATNPELRFDVDNGATLCMKHHKEFHAVMGHSCTRHDFEIYRDRWYRKEKAA